MLAYAKTALIALQLLRKVYDFFYRKKWINEGRKQILDQWALANAKLIIKRYELDKEIAGIPDDDTDDWLRKRGSKK